MCGSQGRARVLTGGGMCVHQGVDAFRLFTEVWSRMPHGMHRTFAACSHLRTGT